MRDSVLKRRWGDGPLIHHVRWPDAGLISALAFLALPGCSVLFSPGEPPGAPPIADAVFCDVVAERHCATADEQAVGIRLAAAAIALNTGQTGTVGLDDSPEARARCGGDPEAVAFRTAFPEGQPFCVNCGDSIGPAPAPFLTATDLCVNRCPEIVAPGADPPDQSVLEFCQENARTSTNFVPEPPSRCFAGACTEGGALLADFADPRRTPEPIVWRDRIGVSAAGNDLTRTAATTTDFDAGAASEQWIERGDAYVEFSANESTLSHVAGLAEIPPGCAFPCADADPGLGDIDFAISLNVDGRFYVIESGLLIAGPGINGSFGTYAPGERFRVTLRDNSDGTAAATYSRLTAVCMPGGPCPEATFYTHASPARYPLRVDASFRETGATLADVRVVRIR